jgi:hypothetical protein
MGGPLSARSPPGGAKKGPESVAASSGPKVNRQDGSKPPPPGIRCSRCVPAVCSFHLHLPQKTIKSRFKDMFSLTLLIWHIITNSY